MYPIKRKSQKIPIERQVDFMTFGENSLRSNKRNSIWTFTDKDQNSDLQSYDEAVQFKNLKFPAWKDHEDTLGDHALHLMIFSHGLTASGSFYMSYMREVASHGYLVIALEHLDKSNNYTQKEDGTQVLFDTSKIFFDENYRKH